MKMTTTRRRSWVGLVALLLAAAACGDDDTSPVDGGSDLGRDASLICTAVCDNRVFCDGIESCAPGTTGADSRGCVPGTPPCAAGESCVEVTTSCRPCASVDADRDGVTDCDGDCDDSDPTRYPGATELCDYVGRDEDCNNTTFGTKDDDADGFVDARCCNGTSCGRDCDDTRGGAHPGLPEVCNHRDDDCNGIVDEDSLVEGHVDADRDLYGAGPRTMACAGNGLSVTDTDCDDLSPAAGRRSPAFEEVAGDGIDNDCDGMIDEGGVAALWYRDSDGDGFGVAADTQTSSTVLADFALLARDCDDTNGARNPSAIELCNGLDDDCNGLADAVIGLNDWEDDDRDGFVDIACGGAADDCDDGSAATHRGAVELCDGRDNDCDGATDEMCAVGLDGGVPMDSGVPTMDAGAPMDAGVPPDLGRPVGCAPRPTGDRAWAQYPLPGTPGHPRDYRASTETVLDCVTGLEWERGNSSTKDVWTVAERYCADLVAGGFADWRLPLTFELMTLVDYDIGDPGPTIDIVAFPGTPGDLFWTGSGLAPLSINAWQVQFYVGYAYYGARTTPGFARCVR